MDFASFVAISFVPIMVKLTQRDIAETVSGLRATAEDLQTLSRGTLIEGLPHGTVLAKISTLQEMSQYLKMVAEELLTLIPNRTVPTLPKD